MADYKKMYLKLFNKVSFIISELQEIQHLTESLHFPDEADIYQKEVQDDEIEFK